MEDYAAIDAVNYLIEAYGENQDRAAPLLYISIEKLENALGGEKKLIEFLGQSKAYIKDLKPSLQPHRHAETQAQIKLSHPQLLERTTEVIEKYSFCIVVYCKVSPSLAK